MVNWLAAAAALAAAAPTQPPSVVQPSHITQTSQPAMFVVRDEDTTVYIFGTFHALDGGANWFSDHVRDAFEHSNELVLETLIPEGPVVPAAFGRAFRPPSVTPSASFLATTRMALSAGRAQGMKVDNGADMVLRRAAEAEGKPVAGLETLEFQLDMFNHMPDAQASAPAP